MSGKANKLIDSQAETLEREALDGLRAVVGRLDRLRETGPRTGKLMERVDRAFTATRAALHDWEDATRQPPSSPITQPCRNCGAVSLRYAVDPDCPDVVLVCAACGRVRTKLQRQPPPRDPGTPPDLA